MKNDNNQIKVGRLKMTIARQINRKCADMELTCALLATIGK